MSACIQNVNMHVKKYESTYRRMNVNMHSKLNMHIKEKLHVNIQYTAPFLDDIIFHLVFRFCKEDLSEDWTPRSPVVLGISRISDLRMVLGISSPGSNSVRQIWSPRSLLTTGALQVGAWFLLLRQSSLTSGPYRVFLPLRSLQTLPLRS